VQKRDVAGVPQVHRAQAAAACGQRPVREQVLADEAEAKGSKYSGCSVVRTRSS